MLVAFHALSHVLHVEADETADPYDRQLSPSIGTTKRLHTEVQCHREFVHRHPPWVHDLPLPFILLLTMPLFLSSQRFNAHQLPVVKPTRAGLLRELRV